MKEKTIRYPKEAEEARAFWEEAQYHHIAKDFLFAIPNGGSRNIIEARNMRLQGIRAGVSDYFLAYPANGKCGLWIELKRTKKSLSQVTEEQAIWLERCERVGYAVSVAYGAEDAMRAVNHYLN